MSARVTGAWIGERNKEGNFLVTLYLPASGAGHVNFLFSRIALLQLAALAVDALEKEVATKSRSKEATAS